MQAIPLCHKRGRETWEEYKDVVWMCRERIRKEKAQLELNLVIGVHFIGSILDGFGFKTFLSSGIITGRVEIFGA